MIEKPKSRKAKSHYRHNSSQDHGDAGQRKGHEDYGYWENKWDQRGTVNADKAYLKEIIRDGLDDYYAHMSPAELELEADRILDEHENYEGEYNSSSDTKEKSSLTVETDDAAGAEIKTLLHEDVVEESFGVNSRRAERKRKERAATLDDYSDDDFGDTDTAVGARIRNVR